MLAKKSLQPDNIVELKEYCVVVKETKELVLYKALQLEIKELAEFVTSLRKQ